MFKSPLVYSRQNRDSTLKKLMNKLLPSACLSRSSKPKNEVKYKKKTSANKLRLTFLYFVKRNSKVNNETLSLLNNGLMSISEDESEDMWDIMPLILLILRSIRRNLRFFFKFSITTNSERIVDILIIGYGSRALRKAKALKQKLKKLWVPKWKKNFQAICQKTHFLFIVFVKKES